MMDASSETRTVDARRGPRPAPVRGIVVALVLLALLTCANLALTWALVPWGGQTDAVWEQYRACADEDIDTVFVGASFAQHALDPNTIDPVLGSSSFCLATPSQSRAATLTAIRDAYEDHHVRRVVMGVAGETVVNSQHEVMYDVAYALAESRGRSVPERVATYGRMLAQADYVGTADSVAALFPWVPNNVGFSLGAARANIAARRNFPSALAAANSVGLHYKDRGFLIMEGAMDVDDAASRVAPCDPNEYAMGETTERELREICRWCRDHDVTLYLVVTPRPAFSLLRYDAGDGYGYVDLMARFEALAREEGATLLDYTMARPEAYRAQDDEFHDAGHLNFDGAERFGPVLAQDLADLEAGEDVSKRFFPHTHEGWDAYVASVEGISIAFFDPVVGEDAFDLVATSYAGADTRVEYAFDLLMPDGSALPLRDWSEDRVAHVPTSQHATATVRMRAREVGSAVDAERTCTKTFLY